MTRVLLHGAGRMARRVLAQMPGFESFELAGIVCRSGDVDVKGAESYGALPDAVADIDLLIDFTLAGGTAAAARWCEANGVALLSGTTGLTEDDQQALKRAAQKVPVLWAPNLSFGVALVTSLVRRSAAALGVEADIHISETHHKHKADAPSGTALALAAAVLEGRDEKLEDLLDPARLQDLADGGAGELGFTSVREGEVIGEHTVRFTLPGEVIELRHEALEREVFANGALKAGEWLVNQPPGYYSTADWLGLG